MDIGDRQSEVVQRPRAWGLWMWWVIASAIGGITGEALASGLANLASAFGEDLHSLYALPGLFLNALQVPLIWLTVSSTQWFALSRYFRQAHRAFWLRWVLSSTAGGIAAVIISMFTGTMAFLFVGGLTLIATSPSETAGTSASFVQELIRYGAGSLAAFLMGVVAGVIIGGAQWLALRLHARDEAAWMWIGTSALGWGIGFVAVTLSFPGAPITLMLILGDQDIQPGVAAGSIAVTTAAAISGIALVKILADAQSPQQSRGVTLDY